MTTERRQWRWFRIDWSGPLTVGWSFFYDNAGAFYITKEPTDV